MRRFKYSLIGAVFGAFLALFVILSHAAQPYAQEAMPVEVVKGESLAEPVNPMAAEKTLPVVIELFSSQACVFCPQADRLFGELIQQTNIIGIACHVDYFDVREGSLSHPFCKERQSWYQTRLEGGLNYTPQLVVQGTRNIVGYKVDDVKAAVKKAGEDKIALINMTQLEGRNFELKLPPAAVGEERELHLFILRKPQTITVAEGGNRGKVITYNNILRDYASLGVITEESKTISIEPDKDIGGFVTILQNKDTGQIAAAGQATFRSAVPAPKKAAAVKKSKDKTLAPPTENSAAEPPPINPETEQLPEGVAPPASDLKKPENLLAE